MNIHFDAIGNIIEVDDEVLILVPKTDASYRRGIVKDFRNECPTNNICEVLVEYNDGRLYCDKPWYRLHEGDSPKFKYKFMKAWRFNNNIIKLNEECTEAL